MQYVAGLDGGGTKTAVTVLSCDGTLCDSAVFGSMNLNGSSFQEVQKTVIDSFNWLSQRFGGLNAIKCVCIGSAGISNPDAAQLLNCAVKDSGFHGKVILIGDQEAALYGALSARDGAILISGTGSICTGKNGENTARAGGFGHLIDDEGSGYAIGRDILAKTIQSFDARKTITCLSSLVFDYLQISKISQLIAYVYKEQTTKKDVAALAFLLDKALLQGDKEAFVIANKAAENLFILASSIIKELNLQNDEICFAGSILQRCDVIRNKTQALISNEFSNIKFVQAENNAAYGAALYALSLAKNNEVN